MFDSKWCIQPQRAVSEDAKLWVLKYLAGIGPLCELIVKGRSICRWWKSAAAVAGFFGSLSGIAQRGLCVFITSWHTPCTSTAQRVLLKITGCYCRREGVEINSGGGGGSWPGAWFAVVPRPTAALLWYRNRVVYQTTPRQFSCPFFFFYRFSLFRQRIHLCYLCVSWAGGERAGRHRYLLSGHMVLLACG